VSGDIIGCCSRSLCFFHPDAWVSALGTDRQVKMPAADAAAQSRPTRGQFLISSPPARYFPAAFYSDDESVRSQDKHPSSHVSFWTSSRYIPTSWRLETALLLFVFFWRVRPSALPCFFAVCYQTFVNHLAEVSLTRHVQLCGAQKKRFTGGLSRRPSNVIMLIEYEPWMMQICTLDKSMQRSACLQCDTPSASGKV
jgi:hypothetical protein